MACDYNIERVFKWMKQRLRLKQIRRQHRPSVAATVRALLSAWAWHAGAMATIRASLPTSTPPAPTPVSRWSLPGLSLDTLRQHVQGTWSPAQLQACLPRLHRFVVLSPRRRAHQETQARACLIGQALLWPANEEEAA